MKLIFPQKRKVPILHIFVGKIMHTETATGTPDAH